MDKVIVLDEKMRRAADLDPDKVIDPVTIEDAQAGECSLRMGYPATGPLAPGWIDATWEHLLTDYGAVITWDDLIAQFEEYEEPEGE